jgi:hypothetical protein
MQGLLNFRNFVIRNLISILPSIFIAYTSQKSSNGWRVAPPIQVSFIYSVVAREFCSFLTVHNVKYHISIGRLHTLLSIFTIRAFYFCFYAWVRGGSKYFIHCLASKEPKESVTSMKDLKFSCQRLRLLPAFRSWRWRHYALPKRRWTCTTLYDLTSQKTVLFKRLIVCMTVLYNESGHWLQFLLRDLRTTAIVLGGH